MRQFLEMLTVNEAVCQWYECWVSLYECHGTKCWRASSGQGSTETLFKQDCQLAEHLQIYSYLYLKEAWSHLWNTVQLDTCGHHSCVLSIDFCMLFMSYSHLFLHMIKMTHQCIIIMWANLVDVSLITNVDKILKMLLDTNFA